MAYQVTQRYVALGSTSTATSTALFTGDFRTVSISYESKASLGASRFTVYASNADGLQVGDLGNTSQTTGWSIITGVNMVGVTPGAISFTTGFRWMRVSVDVTTQSAASYTTVTFHGASW